MWLVYPQQSHFTFVANLIAQNLRVNVSECSLYPFDSFSDCGRREGGREGMVDTQLLILDLDENGISDEGVEHLTKRMADMKYLTKFGLRSLDHIR